MTRYFAFGCSYVDYQWAMLPDLIGANFDEYYNFGASGASHDMMLILLTQACLLYKFNPDTDYVTIGTTGFGRFSYVEFNEVNNLHDWKNHGDIFPGNENHPEKCRLWANNFDSYIWSIFRTLSSLNSMKLILNSMNIKHTIYTSLYNNHYSPEFIQRNPLDKYSLTMLDQILDLQDIKESIDELNFSSIEHNDLPDWIKKDDHPPISVSYQYLKKYFPQFDTLITKKFYDEQLHMIISSKTQQECNDKYQTSKNKFQKDLDNINKFKTHPYYNEQV